METAAVSMFCPFTAYKPHILHLSSEGWLRGTRHLLNVR